MRPYKTERISISGPKPVPCNAAAYIRVSTEEQARGGVSLDAQHERSHAYCTMTGLDLLQVIREEGVSGAKHLETRPGGQKLIALVARGTIQHVVALKLDRIFRDAEDALRQTKAWDRAGVALHLVDMGGQSLNTASAMGRFFLNTMAGFAELERNLIAERTAAALAHKKTHLQAYSPTPFGFERHGSQLVENKQELETIREMQAWRAAGWTLRRIADELSVLKVMPKAGGRKWYASTVRHVLNNDLYRRAA